MSAALRCLLATSLLIGVAGATAVPAAAATIAFKATDLSDVNAGEDLWMYEFNVTGIAFAAGDGFSVYFDPSLYAGLESPPPPVSADWDLLTLQPDPALPADGIYDALALVNDASIGQPFTLSFIWLGGAGRSPAAQRFTINRFDSTGGVSILEEGETVPATAHPVPEPSTLFLLATGAVVALRRARHRKKK